MVRELLKIKLNLKNPFILSLSNYSLFSLLPWHFILLWSRSHSIFQIHTASIVENIGSIKTVVPGFGSYIFISDHLHHQRFAQRRTDGCTNEPPQLPVVESSIPAINEPQQSWSVMFDSHLILIKLNKTDNRIFLWSMILNHKLLKHILQKTDEIYSLTNICLT